MFPQHRGLKTAAVDQILGGVQGAGDSQEGVVGSADAIVGFQAPVVTFDIEPGAMLADRLGDSMRSAGCGDLRKNRHWFHTCYPLALAYLDELAPQAAPLLASMRPHLSRSGRP